MSCRSTIIGVLLAAMVTIVIQSVGASSIAQLLRVGDFHGTEVTERSGLQWVGLYRTSDGFELRTTHVRMEPCFDPVVDADSTRKSGIRVSADRGEPLVLIRGIPSLVAGPVRAVISKPHFFSPGERQKVAIGRRQYQLAAKGKYDPARPAHDGLVLGYGLRLIGPNGRSQDLPVPSRFAEDGVPALLWAGDLDRDGKLDLLVDLTDHYNVREPALLLSSAATGRDLVQLVARFRTTGC